MHILIFRGNDDNDAHVHGFETFISLKRYIVFIILYLKYVDGALDVYIYIYIPMYVHNDMCTVLLIFYLDQSQSHCPAKPLIDGSNTVITDV